MCVGGGGGGRKQSSVVLVGEDSVLETIQQWQANTIFPASCGGWDSKPRAEG